MLNHAPDGAISETARRWSGASTVETKSPSGIYGRADLPDVSHDDLDRLHRPTCAVIHLSMYLHWLHIRLEYVYLLYTHLEKPCVMPPSICEPCRSNET